METTPLPPPPDLPEDLRVYFGPHRDERGFFNPWGRFAQPGPRDLLRWKMGNNPFSAAKKRRPDLPIAADPRGGLAALPEGARALWLGHASFLVEMDGTRLLIDPVFGRAGGLVPRAAPAPLAPDALPGIDAVLLTHGHHDHLDAASVRALAKRFGAEVAFLAPSGLRSALPAGSRAVEADWWTSVRVGPLTCTFVPAQHWHRRGLRDFNQALWGGWVIAGSRTIYHSGDTGYFGGFSAIGAAFPRLDLAILPLGAYEPRWFMSPQHASPEGSLQAFADLGARHFLAMHWGTFDLTDEPLDHGVSTLLPELVDRAGLDPGRFTVLPHGGSLGWDGETVVTAR